MPAFSDGALSPAPVGDVWNLLDDPTRFPEWWAGFDTLLPPDEIGDGHSRFTYFPTGYPDYPMPQLLDTFGDQQRIVVSCRSPTCASSGNSNRSSTPPESACMSRSQRQKLIDWMRNAP